MGSDARGGEGAKEAPQLLDVVQVRSQQGQERKPRASAGVTVSFGVRPAVAAAPPRPKRLTTVLVVDKARLCCSLCCLALKRPIYQCAVGHLACSGCRMKLPVNGCRTCRDHGAASEYALCPGLDVFYGDLYLPCPYEQFGCRSYIPYYRAASHQSACEHAPCLCPEPGCAFAGPPAALLAHLAAAHSWPVHKIPCYGRIYWLWVPAASVPDRLLVVGEEKQQDEDDDDEEECKDDDAERPTVFVLSVRLRGAAAAVSVACVRANARAGPQYRCVLWAKAPSPQAAAAGRAGTRLCMETDVPSCAAPGQGVTEDAMWLGVSPVMMLGASREIHLGIFIDKL